MRNLQLSCDRFEKEAREAKESLLETTERLQEEIEMVCFSKLFTDFRFRKLLLFSCSF